VALIILLLGFLAGNIASFFSTGRIVLSKFLAGLLSLSKFLKADCISLKKEPLKKDLEIFPEEITKVFKGDYDLKRSTVLGGILGGGFIFIIFLLIYIIALIFAFLAFLLLKIAYKLTHPSGIFNKIFSHYGANLFENYLNPDFTQLFLKSGETEIPPLPNNTKLIARLFARLLLFLLTIFLYIGTAFHGIWHGSKTNKENNPKPFLGSISTILLYATGIVLSVYFTVSFSWLVSLCIGVGTLSLVIGKAFENTNLITNLIATASLGYVAMQILSPPSILMTIIIFLATFLINLITQIGFKNIGLTMTSILSSIDQCLGKDLEEELNSPKVSNPTNPYALANPSVEIKKVTNKVTNDDSLQTNDNSLLFSNSDN